MNWKSLTRNGALPVCLRLIDSQTLGSDNQPLPFVVINAETDRNDNIFDPVGDEVDGGTKPSPILPRGGFSKSAWVR